MAGLAGCYLLLISPVGGAIVDPTPQRVGQMLLVYYGVGRVGSVNSLFIGASNELGGFESGVAAAALGPVGAVVVGGIGTLLVVGMIARLAPQLRDLGALGK